MRWIYHVLPSGERVLGDYAPASLVREGFVHGSHRDDVAGTIREYFATFAPSELTVLQIDPRRVGARVEVADTPRGPMPHVMGPIPRDAIRAEWSPAELSRAPDRVTGTRVACIAFSGMTLLDLVSAYDPLSRIASMGFDPSFVVEIVSAEPQVWSDSGARLEITSVRPKLDPYDLLVLPGGRGAEMLARDPEVAGWLASYPSNRWVASVCTGALVLGALGRLRGLRATTHATNLHRLAAFGATAVSERVVDEGRVVTAGGVTCGLDLGLHLVERIEDASVRARIATQMEVPGLR